MVYVALDERLCWYSFPDHPFNNQRYFVFKRTLEEKNLLSRLRKVTIRSATSEELLLFHSPHYLDFVKREKSERVFLDGGDTPAFKGVWEAGRIVVGTTLSCIDKAIEENTKVFTPVGGLHHAYKDKASGFCVFNDICVGINYLREKYRIKKVLYFDIDAHHGDGVYYSFAEDPDLYIVDFHQGGIFPGTGYSHEKGKGDAWGTKWNIELETGASDEDFFKELPPISKFLKNINPEFIIFQAGCDCLRGDPLTSLNLSEKVHLIVTRFLVEVAEEETKGKMVILGGGGYLAENIKRGWGRVIEELLRVS